jgi:hypothetical protein
MAAHAACADAALADDRHWDAVSASGGAPEGSGDPMPSRRSAGCLALACLVAATALAAALAVPALAARSVPV